MGIKNFDEQKERENAIKNLGGNIMLYEKYLAKFKANYANIDTEIEALIAVYDFKEAYRLAHSVKGLSATLGLMSLSSAAMEFEASLKEALDNVSSHSASPSIIADKLTSFQAILKSVCR